MLGSEKHETHQEKSRACGSSSAMESEGQTYTKLPPQAASYLRRTKRNQLNRERTTMKHIMTEEEIQHRIKAAEAFLRGGECEGRYMGGEWRPVRETSGEREWSGNAFFDPTIRVRIKALPTLVPLEQKDWVNGPWWITSNPDDYWLSVTRINPDILYVGVITYLYGQLLAWNWKRSRTCLPDSWEVCGKEGV